MDTANMVIGWRAIGQASNLNPASLCNANSLGLLPVTPMRVGSQVAMTPEQIEVLRKGGRHG